MELQTNVKLMCCMMIRNEEHRAVKTIQSLTNIIDKLLILDTYSTDNTVEMVRKACHDLNIPLQLYQEKFTNYRDTMNILLNYAHKEPEYTFLLLLDANAEVRNGHVLRPFLNNIDMKDIEKKIGAFASKFVFDNDNNVPGLRNVFPNFSIIRNTPYIEWKELPVHCHLGKSSIAIENKISYSYNNELLNTPFEIYQDRLQDRPTKDRIKSFDLPSLIDYHNKIDKQNLRCMRYIAQSYYNIGEYDLAIKWCKKLLDSYDNQKRNGVEFDVYNDDVYNGYILLANSSGAQFTTENFGKRMEFTGDIKDEIEDIVNQFNIADKYVCKSYKYCGPIYHLSQFLTAIQLFDKAYETLYKCCYEYPLIKNSDAPLLSISINIFTQRWKNLMNLALTMNKKDDYNKIINKMTELDIFI